MRHSRREAEGEEGRAEGGRGVGGRGVGGRVAMRQRIREAELVGDRGGWEAEWQ